MENSPLSNSALELEYLKPKFPKQSKSKKAGIFVLGAAVIFIFLYFIFLKAPSNFPVGKIINIEEGMSLRSVSRMLENENIIKSRVAFEAFIIFYGGEKHIIPADYLFERRTPVFEVARRIAEGDRHLAPVKVTIPEGFNTSEAADIFASKLAFFNKENFLLATKGKEGYLFPDTYFFFTTDTEEEAIQLINVNFEKKVAPLRPAIISSGKTEEQIITMASIIEREAKGDADRAFISGILWRRFAIGMPLQVDAALETYKTKGLPKDPICNPGLQSIEAAIHPTKSNYLYYLHDKEGVIHYASNFEEHKANKAKYLR